ncbi:sigma-70 family RNA polymerase sigma factor [Limnoglobus roseus]|uniref:Sigma-70 family RNA polymerase sigma factor n=1 Tax=Limnoglobus roseus TaxID=2598579 RepID=A0A5C1AN64_9BACT|nr:sigma-70 family RNA polymerase sigma factor [Limnoglobus roseus]QEL20671.1 sigma-70 family RNA polymerase sigma factor [Limnoglobus roseus]
MPDDQSPDVVAAFLQRIRAGDPAAHVEFAARYGPQIRRVVRIRRAKEHVQGLVESEDLVQTVLRRMWEKPADLKAETLGELLAWARAVAWNRVREFERKRQLERGNFRRLLRRDDEPPDGTSGEDASVSLASVRTVLSAEERRIFDARLADRTWAEIAADLGRTGEAVRKQFERAIRRVQGEAGT